MCCCPWEVPSVACGATLGLRAGIVLAAHVSLLKYDPSLDPADCGLPCLPLLFRLVSACRLAPGPSSLVLTTSIPDGYMVTDCHGSATNAPIGRDIARHGIESESECYYLSNGPAPPWSCIGRR